MKYSPVAVWLVLFSIAAIAWLARDLPDLETLPPPGLNDRIEVQSENGDLLAAYGAIYGEWLDYEQIPGSMVDALVAIEDRRFFDHGAVDFRGIERHRSARRFERSVAVEVPGINECVPVGG